MLKNVYTLNQKNSFDRNIEYNLYESDNVNKKCYGIQVKLISEKIKEEVNIKDISCNLDFVRNLIDYLYENAVGTVHFKDVVEDYMLLSEINV